MGRTTRILAVVALLGAAFATSACSGAEDAGAPVGFPTPASAIPLPQPRTTGGVSVEQALAQRRSVRAYAPDPLALAQVAQLLWAAQGVTSAAGGRTAPSAGALHPLEVHLVAGAVVGLAPGVYRYVPDSHALVPTRSGDVRRALADAALGQDPVAAAGASIVISGAYGGTRARYGDRAERFVHMEAGHAAQNVCLQAVALGLGTVPVGALTEAAVRDVLDLADGQVPLYVMPVGRLG